MNNNFKWILCLILILLGVLLWKSQEPRLKQHNKYQCAVYGLDETCQNVLPEDKRLK